MFFLDRPEVLMFLFHPRAETVNTGDEGAGREILIPVEANIAVGARFYSTHTSAPTILFFHGNGESIVNVYGMGITV
jgi:hypothetical protein